MNTKRPGEMVSAVARAVAAQLGVCELHCHVCRARLLEAKMVTLRCQGLTLDAVGARVGKMTKQNVWRSLRNFERFAAQQAEEVK